MRLSRRRAKNPQPTHAPTAPATPQAQTLARPGRDPLPRVTVALITLAAAWFVVSGLREYKDITAPLLLTLNLLIVAYPVQSALVRRGAPRMVGAIANGIIVFTILLLFFGALGWSLSMLIQELPNYGSQFKQIYGEILQLLSQFGMSEQQLQQQLSSVSPSNVAGALTGVLSSVTGAFSLFVVTVTIIFVALIDSTAFPNMMRAARSHRPELVEELIEFGKGVRRYWVVSTIFGLIVAVLDVIALLFLGVPLALVWGVLSFLTNYIPNIGFVLGLVPPALMALLANDPMTALLVVVAYSVINFLIQSVIQPKFNGQAIGVNATLSLLSLIFWAMVLGPLGALLALPATLLVKTLLIDDDPKARWLNAFIAADPKSAVDPDSTTP